jgi:hypothetical protein
MLSWLLDGWSRSKKFTESEISVLRILLPSNNPNAEMLYAQALQAPSVERKLVGRNGYEATISYLSDDSLLIEADVNIQSPAVTLPSESGLPLTFTTEILKGGFLKGLQGVCPQETAWPKIWIPILQGFVPPKEVFSWVPYPLDQSLEKEIVSSVLKWCGLPRIEMERQMLEAVCISRPASETALAMFESHFKLKIGVQYRSLLEISNGLEVRGDHSRQILGIQNAEWIGQSHHWLGISPLYEEGWIALKCENGQVTDACYALVSDDQFRYIGDLLSYVRAMLSSRQQM